MKKKEIFTIIKDGHPYTYSCYKYLRPGQAFYSPDRALHDDDGLLSALPQDKYDEALSVLKRWFIKSNKTSLRHTSYGYKHWLESEIGHYISNNQLKDAMLISGFEPGNYDELNWCFKVKPTEGLKKWLDKRGMRW